MLDKFLKRFNISVEGKTDENHELFNNIPLSLYQLINDFGGSTFNEGLYRIHTFSSSIQWSIKIADYFPDYKNKIYPFGIDWLGKQYCLSNSSENTIFMFDPETGEAFNIEQSLIQFHNEDLIDQEDDLLSQELFEKCILKLGKTSIEFVECIALKIPLFLGGEDKIENYTVQDLEVYWEMQKQIYYKIQNLPDGTPIGEINIE